MIFNFRSAYDSLDRPNVVTSLGNTASMEVDSATASTNLDSGLTGADTPNPSSPLHSRHDSFKIESQNLKRKNQQHVNLDPLELTNNDRHRNYLNRTLLHTGNFERRTTSKGQVYFVNRVTGQSTWNNPSIPADINNLPESSGSLPDGWEARYTPTGRKYFVDHNSKTTQFAGKWVACNRAEIRDFV